jgi:hypothetical protein
MANFNISNNINIVEPNIIYNNNLIKSYSLIVKNFNSSGVSYSGFVNNANGQYNLVSKLFTNYSVKNFISLNNRPLTGQLFPI